MVWIGLCACVCSPLSAKGNLHIHNKKACLTIVKDHRLLHAAAAFSYIVFVCAFACVRLCVFVCGLCVLRVCYMSCLGTEYGATVHLILFDISKRVRGEMLFKGPWGTLSIPSVTDIFCKRYLL